MGLRQTVAEWIRIAKDALDFGPEFPAALADHRIGYADKLTQLQTLLEQAQKASQQKDKLIAKLRAANLVFAGSVYFIQKENLFEGPYCTSCLEQQHETGPIVFAPRPKGADGPAAHWVQCTLCGATFCSEQVARYLNPALATPEPAAVAANSEGETPPAKAKSPRASTRRRKNRPPESTEAAADSTQPS